MSLLLRSYRFPEQRQRDGCGGGRAGSSLVCGAGVPLPPAGPGGAPGCGGAGRVDECGSITRAFPRCAHLVFSKGGVPRV